MLRDAPEYPAPLHIRTPWRQTDAFSIIVIIIIGIEIMWQPT